MSFYEFRKRIMEEKAKRETKEKQIRTESTVQQESVVGRNKFSVALLGLERAGKTSLVKKLLKQEDIMVRPTYGVNLENYQYRDLNFTCFDLGGHQPFRLSLWKKFIERADACLLYTSPSPRDRS